MVENKAQASSAGLDGLTMISESCCSAADGDVAVLVSVPGWKALDLEIAHYEFPLRRGSNAACAWTSAGPAAEAPCTHTCKWNSLGHTKVYDE